MMKIRRLQYRVPAEPEINDAESQTIPDQALTVRQILTNFTRSGTPLPDFETGEPDDIDSDTSFGDIVDASEAFERGASVYNDIVSNQNEVDTHKNKQVSEVDNPTVDDVG